MFLLVNLNDSLIFVIDVGQSNDIWTLLSSTIVKKKNKENLKDE